MDSLFLASLELEEKLEKIVTRENCQLLKSGNELVNGQAET